MIATGALAQGTDVIAQPDTSELIVDALVRILGFALLAGGTSSAAAVTYRWYSADEIPEGVAVLVGVSTVAVWLNTKSALGDAILGKETTLTDPATALYTVLAFAISAIAADGGRRLGDHLARNVFAVAARHSVDDVTDLVRSAGRVVGVDLPETIDDAHGYDPVDPETKTSLSGRTLRFPRGLDPAELEYRLVARLERDFGVGHVDLEMTPDGTVESLAVGSRPSGVGPTLAPGSVAVAIRADPSPDASPGDAVEVWADDGAPTSGDESNHDRDARRSEPGDPTGDDSNSAASAEAETAASSRAAESGSPATARRLTGAELRATAGDVTTLVVDADDADALSADRTYRLVTLPGTADVTRQLVSLYRTADETVTTERIESGGPLEGDRVGSLPVTVLSIRRGDDAVALPDPEVVLEAGDVVYVLGAPAALGRLNKRKRSRTPGRRREGDRDETEGRTGGPRESADDDAPSDGDAASKPSPETAAENRDR